MNKCVKYILEVYLFIGFIVFVAHFHGNNFDEAAMKGIIWPAVAYDYYISHYDNSPKMDRGIR